MSATVNPIITRGYGQQSLIITRGYGSLAEEFSQDLFAKFLIRQESLDLFAKFVVVQSGYEDLYTEFTVRHSASEDLHAEFFVQTVFTTDLFAVFTIPYKAYEELFSEFTVQQLTVADLAAEFIVRQTAIRDLFATFETYPAADLKAILVIRNLSAQDLKAEFLLRQLVSELPAYFTIQRTTSLDIFAELYVRPDRLVAESFFVDPAYRFRIIDVDGELLMGGMNMLFNLDLDFEGEVKKLSTRMDLNTESTGGLKRRRGRFKIKPI